MRKQLLNTYLDPRWVCLQRPHVFHEPCLLAVALNQVT